MTHRYMLILNNYFHFLQCYLCLLFVLIVYFPRSYRFVVETIFSVWRMSIPFVATFDNQTFFLICFELLLSYCDELSALECKIPPQEVQIPFKWKDAFDKGSIFGGRMSLSMNFAQFLTKFFLILQV